MTKQENTEQKGSGYDFFIGVAVGIMGNLFVSSFIEWSASIWEHKPDLLIIQWSIMFLMSSTVLFQLTKAIMKRYVPPKGLTRYLDAITIFFFVIVILAIILALIL